MILGGGELRLNGQVPAFGAGQALATVTAPEIDEASGIAASRHNPGVVWTHNDSDSRLYAVDLTGQLLAEFRVPGLGGADLEDVAIGPGPDPRLSYLYVGDIGDNASSRASIRVFRIPEPAVYPYFAAAPVNEPFPEVESMTFRYPDSAHDAEGLMLDPLSGDLFVLTKAKGFSQVFRAPAAALTGGAEVVLEAVAAVFFDEVSAADISADGSLVLLRQENYANGWFRAAGQTVVEALAGNPAFVPVIGTPGEPNGEGAAFAPDGSGYYTISEGAAPVLYFFPQTTPAPTPSPWQPLVPPGSRWRYRDLGLDEGTAWRTADFDDSTWAEGPAQLGYGNGDEATVVSFGGSASNKRVTTHFRHEFMVSELVMVNELRLRLTYDDGVAVFLNGTEVLRENLAANAAYNTRATVSNSDLENVWLEYAVPATAIRAGRNVVAVEVHRRSLDEADLSFDAQLLANVSPRLILSAVHQGEEVRLRLRGAAGQVVRLEATEILGSWDLLQMLTLEAGETVVDIPIGSGSSVRYFRAVP